MISEFGNTRKYASKMSFPLVGNLLGERLRTSRSDKSCDHTYELLSKILTKATFREPKVNFM